MDPAERITRHYDGDWHGDYGTLPAEGHSKRDRGVSVRAVPDAPDGVLVNTFNGGDPLAEKDRFRRDGLLPERRIGTQSKRESWRCTGTYEYDDGDGNVIYRTRRLEAAGKSKRFVAERLEAGEWVTGLGVLPRLPYRFTELCRAAANARDAGETEPPIYFVEGERKADKLASMGFLATAIAFGANGWREEYGEAFTGSTVFILPDNDEPGRKFAETVKSGVEDHGGVAHIVELPGLPPKGDIMDWAGSADDLRALTAKALTGSLLPLPTLDLAVLATVPPAAKAFAVERLAPLGEVTLFTGPGSAGKSLFGQQLASCAAAGVLCLGLDVMAGPAIYLTCEDDSGQLHWRQSHICRALGLGMADLAGKLHLISLRGALDNELGTFDAEGLIKPTPAFHRLVAMLATTGSKLAILDNVAHLFTGNENDRGDVTRFVNLLNRLAGETGAAIILLGHPNKAGDSYSGSTAWLNAVRSQITVDHDLETDMRTLTVGKANYSRKGEALRFLWHDWAFVLESDLPADDARDLRETVQASADNLLFLTCLRERIRQQRAVSEKLSATYAPKVFATMAESKGIGVKRLEAAMDRLFRINAIERGTLGWDDGHRHPVSGLRETAGDPS